jgi:hypothetical protein
MKVCEDEGTCERRGRGKRQFMTCDPGSSSFEMRILRNSPVGNEMLMT